MAFGGSNTVYCGAVAVPLVVAVIEVAVVVVAGAVPFALASCSSVLSVGRLYPDFTAASAGGAGPVPAAAAAGCIRTDGLDDRKYGKVDPPLPLPLLLPLPLPLPLAVAVERPFAGAAVGVVRIGAVAVRVAVGAVDFVSIASGDCDGSIDCRDVCILLLQHIIQSYTLSDIFAPLQKTTCSTVDVIARNLTGVLR